jgi:hypothetical protein
MLRPFAILLVAAAMAAAATSVSAQDLFSLLFGTPPPHYGQRPAHLQEPSQRPREPRSAGYDPVLGSSSLDYGIAGARGGRDPLYSADPADQGLLKMFLTDRTLARGDIVVTRSGFRVFRGSGSFPYTPADFVPLQATNLRNLAQLMELEATLAPPLRSDKTQEQPTANDARAPRQSQ